MLGSIVRRTAAWLLLFVPFTAASAQSTGYELGPDDAITVTVYGSPEAGVSTRVKPDGTIVLPLIGAVKASGTTVVSLAEVIRRRLDKANFFKDPIVNVEIANYSSRTVNVAGKVTTPGVYPLDKSYRALEILLKAGWLRDQGASYIYLRRADGKEQRLESETLVRGNPSNDPVLAPGDTLYVPDADTFYVYGQINRPGALPVLSGMTVRQAVALAGGPTAAGSDRGIKLLRGNAKEVDAQLDQTVQKGDVLIIKERLF